MGARTVADPRARSALRAQRSDRADEAADAEADGERGTADPRAARLTPAQQVSNTGAHDAPPHVPSLMQAPPEQICPEGHGPPVEPHTQRPDMHVSPPVHDGVHTGVTHAPPVHI
jgi:hypothetical protein